MTYRGNPYEPIPAEYRGSAPHRTTTHRIDDDGAHEWAEVFADALLPAPGGQTALWIEPAALDRAPSLEDVQAAARRAADERGEV